MTMTLFFRIPHMSNLHSSGPASICGLDFDGSSFLTYAEDLFFGAMLTVLGLNLNGRNVLLSQAHSDTLYDTTHNQL